MTEKLNAFKPKMMCSPSLMCQNHACIRAHINFIIYPKALQMHKHHQIVSVLELKVSCKRDDGDRMFVKPTNGAKKSLQLLLRSSMVNRRQKSASNKTQASRTFQTHFSWIRPMLKSARIIEINRTNWPISIYIDEWYLLFNQDLDVKLTPSLLDMVLCLYFISQNKHR